MRRAAQDLAVRPLGADDPASGYLGVTAKDEANAERRRALRARAERQMREWSSTRRRPMVQTIVDAEGSPLPSTHGELRQLECHSGRVFGAEGHLEDAAALRLLGHGHVLTQQEAAALQVCPLDEFAAMVRRVGDSSPGPDGLPCSAWAVTVRGMASLYSVFIALTMGARPQTQRLARRHLHSEWCGRRAGLCGDLVGVRPLTLADTAQKPKRWMVSCRRAAVSV